MPQLGSEPTIQAFERTKKAHVLDRAATAIGADYVLNWGNFGNSGRNSLEKVHWTLHKLNFCLLFLSRIHLRLGPHERTKCVRCIACRDVRCRNRKKHIDLNIRGTRPLLDGSHDVRWFSMDAFMLERTSSLAVRGAIICERGSQCRDHYKSQSHLFRKRGTSSVVPLKSILLR
jgi:hypothetical protein